MRYFINTEGIRDIKGKSNSVFLDMARKEVDIEYKEDYDWHLSIFRKMLKHSKILFLDMVMNPNDFRNNTDIVETSNSHYFSRILQVADAVDTHMIVTGMSNRNSLHVAISYYITKPNTVLDNWFRKKMIDEYLNE